MQEQRARAKADSQLKKTGHVDLSLYRSALEGGAVAVHRLHRDRARGDDHRAHRHGRSAARRHTRATRSRSSSTPRRSTPRAAASSRTGDGLSVNVGGREAELTVVDVQQPLPGLLAHRATVLSGEVRPGDVVLASVDIDRRASVSRSHSATHLLHAGLRKALGDSAAQAGSLNAPGRLRFDFTTPSAVPPSVLGDVEEEINEVLLRDLEVRWFVTDQDEARRIGAIAMFGEKYGEQVRIVEIGDYSRELCGGTHVPRSSVIGMVKLLSEASIGSGRAPRRGAGRAGRLPLPGARARPRPFAGGGVQDAAGRAARAHRRRARTAQERRARAGQAACRAGAGRCGLARGRGGRRRRRPASSPRPRRRASAATTCARSPWTYAAGCARRESGVVVLASAQDGGGVAFVVGGQRRRPGCGVVRGRTGQDEFAPALGARGGGKPDLAQGAGGDAAKLDAAFAAVRSALSAR